MPLPLRTITLAAASCAGGIRCYTKTPQGDVREACNDLTEDALSQAMLDKDTSIIDHGDGWHTGSLEFKCHPESTLCAIAWDTWAESVFYQDEEGAIREWRYTNNKWGRTSFKQTDCKVGTNIAAVFSPGAERVMLFFQDLQGHISYRAAENWQWKDATVKLPKASDGSGIGVTAWNKLDEVRVYYQDEQNMVRECSGSWHGKWALNPTHILQFDGVLGDITAVSWQANGVHIRLYFQDQDYDIVEYGNFEGQWKPGEFRQAALPNADIIAFVRNVKAPPTYCLSVMWAGQDEILYQRVQTGDGWIEPVGIAYLGFSGNLPGSWTDGRAFTDDTPDIDEKHIRRVCIRYGVTITAIKLDFDDESGTPWHGGHLGQEKEFVLKEDEDITEVWYAADEKCIKGIQFGTSQGRKSLWYGSAEGTPGHWSSEGRALGGFYGCSSDCTNGLMPIWTSRFSTVRPHDQGFLVTVKKLNQQLKVIKTEFEDLHARRIAFDASWGQLTAFKQEAMHAVGDFAESIEMLHDMTVALRAAKILVTRRRQSYIRMQVKVCRDDSDKVEDLFRELADQLSALAPKADELYEALRVKLREAGNDRSLLDSFAAAADDFIQSREFERKQQVSNIGRYEEMVATAEQNHITNLETLKSIKEQSKEPRKLGGKTGERKVKNIYGSADRRATRVIDSGAGAVQAQELLCSDSKATWDKTLRLLEDAKRVLAEIEQDIENTKVVQQEIAIMRPSVEALIKGVEGLVEQGAALHHMSKQFLGSVQKMYHLSKDLDDNDTAKQFAQGILTVLNLCLPDASLKGFLKNPVLIESTMTAIATSNEY